MATDLVPPSPSEAGALPLSDFHNLRFKLIPMIVEGPWVVKTAVRSRPCILGQKVVQRYFGGKGYLEVDIDVGSSVIASQIVSLCRYLIYLMKNRNLCIIITLMVGYLSFLCRGYAKQIVCNVGIVLQGEREDELPERLLASVTLSHLDMECRKSLFPKKQ